jgi:flagellar biosynthesis/type III secretory pathway M-ring protein FliF/YscJ
MTTTPEIRRKNRWLLLALVLFAVGLAVAVYLWMRVKIRENGGVVDPTYSMRLPASINPLAVILKLE